MFMLSERPATKEPVTTESRRESLDKLMINVNPDTKMIIIADFSDRKTGADDILNDTLKSPDFSAGIRPGPSQRIRVKCC